MAEKTTPELPFTLATSTGGMNAPITVTEVNPKGRVRLAALRDGNLYDPAELMRNLAAFVPEVEPVAWRDETGTIWGRHGDRCQVEKTVPEDRDPATLTALYAHPPVTAEPEAYPFWDTRRDLRNRITEHVKAELRDFTTDEAELVNVLNGHPWGNVAKTVNADAHNVVTAEPATAPSVEQIAEVPEFQHDEQCEAEQERDTGAWTMCGCWASRAEATGLKERAEKAEAAHVAALAEVEKVAASSDEWWKHYDIELRRVERYKAALEAADELIEAEHAWGQSKLSAQIAIDERIRREHEVAQASATYSAARAAVEAETSEEA